MLAFFPGSTPVRVYLEPEKKVIDLPDEYRIQLDDKVLKRLASRYGQKNLAIIQDVKSAENRNHE